MNDSQNVDARTASTHRQYTMRNLLGFISVLAVLFVLLRLGWTNTSRRTYSVLVFVIPLLLAYCCYSSTAYVTSLFLCGRKTRVALLAILVLLVAATGYVLWARYRISSASFAFDPKYPRGLPFPDEFIEAYHIPLDLANPAPPGFFKLHAEYPRLQRHLDVLSLLCVAITASVAGGKIPTSAYRDLRLKSPRK